MREQQANQMLLKNIHDFDAIEAEKAAIALKKKL